MHGVSPEWLIKSSDYYVCGIGKGHVKRKRKEITVRMDSYIVVDGEDVELGYVKSGWVSSCVRRR